MSEAVIDVGPDFSRFPAGRDREDGRYSGQAFREDHLVPALDKGGKVEVRLDSAIGYGSSFLEEAFGGLVRVHEFTEFDLDERLILKSDDKMLLDEIRGYIFDASQEELRPAVSLK